MSLAATATEVRKHFSEYMENARKEDVVIQRNGRPYVAMISVEELAVLRKRKEDTLNKLTAEFDSIASAYLQPENSSADTWASLQAADPNDVVQAYKAGLAKRGY